MPLLVNTRKQFGRYALRVRESIASRIVRATTLNSSAVVPSLKVNLTAV